MVIDTALTASTRARGTLLVHACTRAMTAPLEWVIADVVGHPANLQWTAQPIAPAMVRAEYEWVGSTGMAAKIATGIRALPHIRFEITEQTSVAGLDQRFSYTPTLGLFRADIDINGDIVINEQRVRHAMEVAELEGVSLTTALDSMLGTAWDAELEPFRIAADGNAVRWVHKVVG
ncbi:MAG: hypothetical protein RL410_135 [Actinomycetota bacterium]